MSKIRRTFLLAPIVGMALLLPTSALAGGGLKPSQAPLVTVGQHYFGNTGWSPGSGELVELWRLPPLLTSDAITVAWNASATYGYPELCLTQDVDDYSWAENLCNGSSLSSVSNSGSARTVITAKAATSAPFLTFRGECCSNSLPYDFVVESIQHAIGVGLTPAMRITPTSVLTGSANLSNGEPVPDGLVFALTASWVTPVNEASHQRTYRASSSGGGLTFPLDLSTSAQGKNVSFAVTRGADPTYLATSSAAVEIPVVKVKPHHHRRCRRGFRKRRVHGKVRCVRFHHHHHHQHSR
jgi:hypothetical protein